MSTVWFGASVCSLKQKHCTLAKYLAAYSGVTLKLAVPTTVRPECSGLLRYGAVPVGAPRLVATSRFQRAPFELYGSDTVWIQVYRLDRGVGDAAKKTDP